MSSSTSESSFQTMFDDPAISRMYYLAELITGPYADDVVQALSLADSSNSSLHILDLACGTGIVTKAARDVLLKSQALEVKFTLLDRAAAMLSAVRSRIDNEGWSDCTVVQGDMQDLSAAGLEDNTFSHVLCTFGPANGDKPPRCLAECYRVLQPGGTAGFALWESVGWYKDFRDAFIAIRADAQAAIDDGDTADENSTLAQLPPLGSQEDVTHAFEEPSSPDARWWDSSYVCARMREAGFEDVTARVIRRETRYGLEDTLRSCRACMVLVQGSVWTQEQRKMFEGVDVLGKVMSWFERKYKGQNEVLWDEWRGIVAVGRKRKCSD